jgi:hypothetical protein
MAIDAGDVVITFLGDTSQLDQAFIDVNDKAKTATDTLTQGFTGFNQVLDQNQQEWDGLTPKVAEFGNEAEAAMEKTGSTSREAAAEIGLLGELIGVRLPRHVRTFLGEIDLIAPALSAAFGATAILFVVEAITKVIEKITEWAESGEKAKQAWEQYDQTVHDTSQQMQNSIDTVQQALIRMTEGPVAALDFGLQHLKDTSGQTFKAIATDVSASLQAMTAAQSSFWIVQFNSYKEAGDDLKKFQTELQTTMQKARDAFPNEPLKVYDAAVAAVTEKTKQLNAEIAKREAEPLPTERRIVGYQQEVKALEDINSTLQIGINLQKQTTKEQETQDAEAHATKQAAQFKSALDQQIADINHWKEQQHAAYVAGDIDIATYKANELQAEQAITIAREDALRQQIAAYQKAGDMEKARDAQAKLNAMTVNDQTAALKKLNDEEVKHQQATQKIVAEYMKLTEAAIEKQWKADSEAAAKLSAEEQKLLQSETKLAEVQLAAKYKEWEKEINELAEHQLITESQKNDKLNELHELEAKDAVNILKKQLDEQKALIDSYQKQIESAQGNPFFPKSQLDNLQLNLDKAKIAYNNTEAQMIKAQQQMDAKIKDSAKTSHGYWAQLQQDMDNSVNGMIQLRNMAETTFDDLTKAFQSSIAAALMGTESFGQAMQKATAQVLASLASQAIVKALFYTAEGVAHLAMGDAAGAAEYFDAAALMGMVGGAAAVAAHAMAGGTAAKSTSGSTTSQVKIAQNAGTTAAPVAVPTVNVAKLQYGGLVTTPTLAMIGEYAGTRQPEGVIPLGNPQALTLIGRAIAEHLPHQGAAQNITITLHSDITQVAKLLNNGVATNRVKLLSSNSMRLTRRSV